MKRIRLAKLISIFVFTGIFTVLAQSDAVKQYTAKDIDWRVHATVDYQADPKKGPVQGVATAVAITPLKKEAI